MAVSMHRYQKSWDTSGIADSINKSRDRKLKRDITNRALILDEFKMYKDGGGELSFNNFSQKFHPKEESKGNGFLDYVKGGVGLGANIIKGGVGLGLGAIGKGYDMAKSGYDKLTGFRTYSDDSEEPFGPEPAPFEPQQSQSIDINNPMMTKVDSDLNVSSLPYNDIPKLDFNPSLRNENTNYLGQINQVSGPENQIPDVSWQNPNESDMFRGSDADEPYPIYQQPGYHSLEGYREGGEIDEYISGGKLPGNRDGDRGNYGLEDGEFVLNREAVEGMENMFGKGFLSHVNDEMFPRKGYDDGGYISGTGKKTIRDEDIHKLQMEEEKYKIEGNLERNKILNTERAKSRAHQKFQREEEDYAKEKYGSFKGKMAYGLGSILDLVTPDFLSGQILGEKDAQFSDIFNVRKRANLAKYKQEHFRTPAELPMSKVKPGYRIETTPDFSRAMYEMYGLDTPQDRSNNYKSNTQLKDDLNRYQNDPDESFLKKYLEEYYGQMGTYGKKHGGHIEENQQGGMPDPWNIQATTTMNTTEDNGVINDQYNMINEQENLNTGLQTSHQIQETNNVWNDEWYNYMPSTGDFSYETGTNMSGKEDWNFYEGSIMQEPVSTNRSFMDKIKQRIGLQEGGIVDGNSSFKDGKRTMPSAGSSIMGKGLLAYLPSHSKTYTI